MRLVTIFLLPLFPFAFVHFFEPFEPNFSSEYHHDYSHPDGQDGT
jgi:hypothetical protein